MHLCRTLRIMLVAGALVGSGRLSNRSGRAASAPGTAGLPRAASAVPPTGGRRGPPSDGETPFLDLIAGGVIEATAHGSSMRSVEVSIENRGGSPISFVIPIGTFFDSGGRGFQSMITIRDHRVTLSARGGSTAQVPAACANIALRAPMRDDLFQAIQGPPDPWIAATLRGLDWHGAGPRVTQAAVWIMANDARLASLGTRSSGETRVPRFTEDEVALAMWAIDQNGVDITSKAIWEDAPAILAGIRDPAARSWLEAR